MPGLDGLTNDQVALDRQWVFDRADYFANLYERWGDDLIAVRRKQRTLYDGGMGRHAMFCDIEGEFLYLSMRDMQPETVVEVGSGICWSTSWLLRGLVDNGHGLLTSCDIHNLTMGLPEELRAYLHFLHGDALIQDFPDPIDFLLSDSSHNEPYVSKLIGKVFPLVRPGGRICVHDVFKHVTPAHGEAAAVFRYMDQIGVQCYTASKVFPETREKILAARRAAGIVDENIAPGPSFDCLLIMEVPCPS